MSDHGSGFGSATVLAVPGDNQRGTLTIGDSDWFSFAVGNATNDVYCRLNWLQGNLEDSANSGSFIFELYDGAQALVGGGTHTQTNEYAEFRFSNLAVDTYTIKLYFSNASTTLRSYVMYYMNWENGASSGVKGHTDEVEQTTMHSNPILVWANGAGYPVFWDAYAMVNPVIMPIETWVKGLERTVYMAPATPKASRRYQVTPASRRYLVKGIVYKDGVTQVGKLLRLYDRSNGELLGETTSGLNGIYQFDVELFKNDRYYIVAFDDIDNPVLQGEMLDHLLPIETEFA